MTNLGEKLTDLQVQSALAVPVLPLDSAELVVYEKSKRARLANELFRRQARKEEEPFFAGTQAATRGPGVIVAAAAKGAAGAVAAEISRAPRVGGGPTPARG